MKSQKKRLSAAIAFALMATIAVAFLCALPVASADVLLTIANVAAVPKLIGRGQTIYIVGWVDPPPLVSGGLFYNYTFVITKPDGTTVTQFFSQSNEDATMSFNYVCDQVGNWKVVFSWPGDAKHPAVSNSNTWTVQEEAVPNTNPDVPLPTGYWFWPISASNREWYQISGPWPNAWHDGAGTNFNEYSKAPNSAHVLWLYPWQSGGLIGGDQGAYDQVSTPQIPVVAMGRMYYSIPDGVGDTLHPVVVCLDLSTGKEIWRSHLPTTNGTVSRPSGPGGMAITIKGYVKGFVESVTVPGEPARLTRIPSAYSIWMAGSGGLWDIDPWTGKCDYYNPINAGGAAQGKGGGLLMDDDGNLYLIGYPSGNTSKFNTNTQRFDWTIRTPTGNAGLGQAWVYDGLLVGNNRPTGGDPFGISYTSVNTTTGQVVVNGSIVAGGLYPTGGFNGGMNYGKLVEHCIDRYWYAYDLATGQQVWKSDVQSEYPWGVFNMYNAGSGYGMYYQGQYDGYLYALNYTNGKLVWKFFTGNNTDVGPGNNIPWSQFAIADGKIYFATGEHDTPNPLPRGNTLYCLNAFTGELIWKIYGFQDRGTGGAAHAHGISSGVMWYFNTQDGRLWTFGKGQTTTTVSAPETTIPLGDSVLIQGTVMDESPASPGTPAISDADQEAWMEYLHMQNQVFPANAKGVVVHLQAMGSDGNLMDVTHVTTDVMGHYEYTWTPPAQDTYKIIATFEGSESYWSSADQTGLSVGAAPAATPPPEAAPDNTPMFIASTAAIIIAIAIVGVLLLRKRP